MEGGLGIALAGRELLLTSLDGKCSNPVKFMVHLVFIRGRHVEIQPSMLDNTLISNGSFWQHLNYFFLVSWLFLDFYMRVLLQCSIT